MPEFGSGISLDDSWDLHPDDSGDIETDRGQAELQKDMAVLLAERLKPALGQRLTRDVQSDVRIAAEQVLIGDERIDSIRSLTVTDEATNSLRVTADVVTTEGPFELVISLD